MGITMNKLKDFKDRFPDPNEMEEFICINCKHRWIAFCAEESVLKEIKCPNCKEIGFVILTGQYF